MNVREAERRYYELRGRHAAGRLDAAAFAAAVRDLIVRGPGGRLYTLDAETGRWLVHDGERWRPLPTPPLAEVAVGERLRRWRLPLALAVILALTLAVDFALPGRPLLSGFGAPRAAPVGSSSAARPATPAAPGVPAEAPAVPAPASPAAPFPSAAEVEQAAATLAAALHGYDAAGDLEAARVALEPALSATARANPGYVEQLVAIPRSQELRSLRSTVEARGAFAPEQVWVNVSSTYRTPGGAEATIPWSFTLVREDGRWLIQSAQRLGGW